MHVNQVNVFDESYNLDFIEIDESFDEPEITAPLHQVTLAEETQFFFGLSNSNRIAQEIEKFFPELVAKSDELLFTVELRFNNEGKAVLSVPGENIVKVFSLPDFPVRDRSFTFFLYPDQSGCFILRLFSKFHTQE
jgi:hypothetical protein